MPDGRGDFSLHDPLRPLDVGLRQSSIDRWSAVNNPLQAVNFIRCRIERLVVCSKLCCSSCRAAKTFSQFISVHILLKKFTPNPALHWTASPPVSFVR